MRPNFRTIHPVQELLDESSLQAQIRDLGFEISTNMKRPSHILWRLKMSPHITLDYRMELVIRRKRL